MAVEIHIYDEKFFQNTIKLEADSAEAAAQILIKYFQPKSVVDIGCGCGIYLQHFQAAGIEILGYDGAPAAITASLVGAKIKLHDLSQPLKLDKKFDLVLCFEVAEHLEESAADILAQSLIDLGDTIAFTAATPGQGPRSIGHINEQLPEYWIEKFKKHNFILQTELTEKIRQEMIEQNVVWWITKNLMIFKKK